MQSAAAPAATRRGASRRPASSPACRPARSLTVTGTRPSTARTTAATMATARSGVAQQRRAGAGLDDLAHGAGHVEVDQVGAGRDAGGGRRRPPRRRRRRAESRSGARPGRRRDSRACGDCRSGCRRREIISVNTRPAPQRRTLRRKAGVVMPAMGAIITRERQLAERADAAAARQRDRRRATRRPCGRSRARSLCARHAARRALVRLLAAQDQLDAAQRQELVDGR